MDALTLDLIQTQNMNSSSKPTLPAMSKIVG